MSSKPPSLPRANLLVLGSNWINTLLPATLITQADALLQGHRIEDAVAVADQQLKKFQGRVAVDPDDADELRYVYQRIGFQCLTETQFDDAGKHFFAGSLDPRVLISYYPELCGALFDAAPEDDEGEVSVFAGVAEHIPPERTIDDIIAINLVRNYSPHLAPNTSTAPPTVELRRVLKLAATDMLKVYLRKWRLKRRRDEPDAKRVNEAVDTVLAKLYTQSGDTTDLLALLDGPHDVVLPELEPSLISARRFDALCRLYKHRAEHAKLLLAWSRLVTGEWIDEDVQDPLSSMFAFLAESRNSKALVQEWGVWLLKHDLERAMKLLTSLGTSKRSGRTSADDAALLRRIQEAEPQAGSRFLEYLVLQKRSTDPDLHMQLASEYVTALLGYLQDPSVSKAWRAKASAYASSKAVVPFLSYFASTTPDSDAARTRLKTVLFLQGSKLYDPEPLRARLEQCEAREVVGLELAILYGKLARHHDALRTLVHTVRDSSSAEAYCTLGGDVVPPKTAQAIGERHNLQLWAALFLPPGAGAAGKAQSQPTPVTAAMSREKTVDEGVKRDLTKILLEVYMTAGESMSQRTAQLLNAQAVNLDVLDVLAIIPPEWPLRLLSSFVARSLRRTLHARHEGQLVKAISASQNLAVAEETWLVIREQGAIVEEAAAEDDDDDEGEGYDGEKALGEKVGAEGLALELGTPINEKVGVHDLRPADTDGDGGGEFADLG